MFRRYFLIIFTCLTLTISLFADLTYPIVDTGQVRCYSENNEISYPKSGRSFFGQDAQYEGNTPKYKDNRDGTVSDLVTGLMWQKDPGEKKTLKQSLAGASRCRLGGYSDWRVPTIKELYSLILFSGTDPDPMSTDIASQIPFIDTDYFVFKYGDARKQERIIDSQYATSTKYVSTTMHADETMFGVNFADGRIKGYPVKDPRGRSEKEYYTIYVRGNKAYGKNDFKDRGNGTVTDEATGLTWMKVDSGHLRAGKGGKMNWEEALEWAEELEYAGRSDWRLPSVKELQSIVDYTRSPDATKSAAIDPVFKVTSIKVEDGKMDYPFYWSGTTHVSSRGGAAGSYVAFGKSYGWMKDRRTGKYELLDVHGAGSQRSDPKSGDPSKYPRGRGPQGDVLRIYNFVRCVRGGATELKTKGPNIEIKKTSSRKTPPKADSKNMFLQREDRNGDGKVAKSEFRGPSEHFNHLDKNGDGYISAEEAPTGPPPGPRR